MDAFGRGGTRVGAGAPNPTNGVRGLGGVASILQPWRSTQLSPFLLKSPFSYDMGAVSSGLCNLNKETRF